MVQPSFKPRLSGMQVRSIPTCPTSLGSIKEPTVSVMVTVICVFESHYAVSPLYHGAYTSLRYPRMGWYAWTSCGGRDTRQFVCKCVEGVRTSLGCQTCEIWSEPMYNLSHTQTWSVVIMDSILVLRRMNETNWTHWRLRFVSMTTNSVLASEKIHFANVTHISWIMLFK
jgi:hypothetical protein